MKEKNILTHIQTYSDNIQTLNRSEMMFIGVRDDVEHKSARSAPISRGARSL